MDTAAETAREGIIKSLPDLAKKTEDALANISKSCYLADSTGNIKPDFDNKVTHVYLVPLKDGNNYTNYAAVLFEEQSEKGKNQIVYAQQIYQAPQEKALDELSNAITKPSSIIRIVVNPNPNPEWKVTAYEEVDFNKGFQEGKKWKKDFQCNNNYWDSSEKRRPAVGHERGWPSAITSHVHVIDDPEGGAYIRPAGDTITILPGWPLHGYRGTASSVCVSSRSLCHVHGGLTD